MRENAVCYHPPTPWRGLRVHRGCTEYVFPSVTLVREDAVSYYPPTPWKGLREHRGCTAYVRPSITLVREDAVSYCPPTPWRGSWAHGGCTAYVCPSVGRSHTFSFFQMTNTMRAFCLCWQRRLHWKLTEGDSGRNCPRQGGFARQEDGVPWPRVGLVRHGGQGYWLSDGI